jgi:hypothetical protein
LPSRPSLGAYLGADYKALLINLFIISILSDLFESHKRTIFLKMASRNRDDFAVMSASNRKMALEEEPRITDNILL